MIRTLAAALLTAAALTACSTNPPPTIVVKTVHPDGTATCAVKDTTGAGRDYPLACYPNGPDGWATETVTAKP